jgi:hypothetical protein
MGLASALTERFSTKCQKPNPIFALALVICLSPAGTAHADLQLLDIEPPDPFDTAVAAVKDSDFHLAARLFEDLARDDDYEAQFNLALILREGHGRPQNFVQALEWAWLARLGGVSRAVKLSDDLLTLTTPAAQAEILDRIDDRLQQRLARGDRTAVMQYVVFNRSILPQPDVQRAYIWSLIATALGLQDAAIAREETAKKLETRAILEAQEAAREMFEDQDMAVLFAESDANSR